MYFRIESLILLSVIIMGYVLPIKKRGILGFFILFMNGLLIWSLIFSILIFLNLSYYFLLFSYIVLLLSGSWNFIRFENQKWSIFIFAGVLLFLYNIFFYIPVNIWSVDPRNYLWGAATVGFPNWMKNCNGLTVGLRELTDVVTIFTRLPAVSFAWLNNIFSIPLNVKIIFAQSFLYIMMSIYFQMETISILTGIGKIKRSLLLPLVIVWCLGFHLASIAGGGQINQALGVLLLSYLSYLIIGRKEKENNYFLETVSIIMLLWSYPEIFPLSFFVVVMSLVISNKKINLLYILSIFWPSLLYMIFNFSRYLKYYGVQSKVSVGWNALDKVNPYINNIFLTFMNQYEPIVKWRYIFISLFMVLPLLFMAKKTRLVFWRMTVVFLMLILVVLLPYFLKYTGNIKYTLFKYSGWVSYIFLILFVVVLNTKSFTTYRLVQLCWLILLIFITANRIQYLRLYVSHMGPSFGKDKAAYESQHYTKNCDIKITGEVSTDRINVPEILAPKGDCSCEFVF